MKKFFVIFLIIILLLGVFSSVVTGNNFDEIAIKLDEIENNISHGNDNAAKSNLVDLRIYVYGLARELVEQNRYTEQVTDIINFAAKAIETRNIGYIAKARNILDMIKNGKNIIEKGNHS